DLLPVPAGFGPAIADALRHLADAAATNSAEVAVDALRYVRQEDAGQARLVVADAEAEQNSGAPPGGTWAREVVSADEAVAGTINALLHDVVIVEDLHAARTLRQEQPHLSAVTTSGDLLAPGQARGGAAGGPSVLELHAAREEAEAELAGATARIESTRFQLGPARG